MLAAGRSHIEATECLYNSAHSALGDCTRVWNKCTYTGKPTHLCLPLVIHLSMLTGTRRQFKSEVGSSKLLLPLERDQSSLFRVEVIQKQNLALFLFASSINKLFRSCMQIVWKYVIISISNRYIPVFS